MRDVTADLISKVVAAAPRTSVRSGASKHDRDHTSRLPANSNLVLRAKGTTGDGGDRRVDRRSAGAPARPFAASDDVSRSHCRRAAHAERFHEVLCNRLDSISALRIIEGAESVDLQPVWRNRARRLYMLVRRRTSGEYYCALSDMPPLLSVKAVGEHPLSERCREVGGNVVGVILTGMGRDGTMELWRFHGKGAHIIAESQETCVVFGMPKAASEAGVVDELLPLHEIPEAIMRAVRG